MDALPSLQAFLQPLQVNRDRIVQLSHEFASNFTHLAAHAHDQFLPTPISESILLPPRKRHEGRFLAIDIGGTNVRVGFIELLAGTSAAAASSNGHDAPALRRLLEKSWPIQEHLKNQNVESLFAWIGHCIVAVVQQGCTTFGLPPDEPLPMGVTFSFPMEQESLAEAKLMAMGKGFAMAPKLDLGSCLIRGYEQARAKEARPAELPHITVAAITNDAVATLVSFIYELPAQVQAENSQQHNQKDQHHQTFVAKKPVMGLICGTGSNATLLLKRSLLHPLKQPAEVHVLSRPRTDGCLDEKDGKDGKGGMDNVKVAVNTEWSINGSEPAMRNVGFISRWDDQLSKTVELPGFQPLEYMTSGRYLGELGRIMLVDYLTSVLGLPESTLPAKFLRRFEPHNTTFLSHYRPGGKQSLVSMLEAEFPVVDVALGQPNGTCKEHGTENGTENGMAKSFQWTEEMAVALYHIAKAIETRAAAIIAAAIVGLLDCAGEFPAQTVAEPVDLVVGYTGGCITNFQDYLVDCQTFLDDIVLQRYTSLDGSGSKSKSRDSTRPCPVRIVLSPCHDGGIKGAGILVPASLASEKLEDR